ncbi:hypothetical protein [Halocatena halophila]|uniref:hypothetical protein n=1 Tax=Halocatena halophila TaxID=2814576 RepID=UPI002ED2327E
MYDRITLSYMPTEPRNLFRHYISCHQEFGGDIGEPLQMALVMGGKKPATTFDPPEEMFSSFPDHSPSTLVEKWGLRYRRVKGDYALMVSPSTHWFDLLPTVGLNNDTGVRRHGLFFGYPFEDIEYFLQVEEAILPGKKYVSEGVFSAEEMAYCVFTFYRPEYSKEGYDRAIEIGKQHYESLHRLSDKWELTELAELTEQLHSDYIKRYTADPILAD